MTEFEVGDKVKIISGGYGCEAATNHIGIITDEKHTCGALDGSGIHVKINPDYYGREGVWNLGNGCVLELIGRPIVSFEDGSISGLKPNWKYSVTEFSNGDIKLTPVGPNTLELTRENLREEIYNFIDSIDDINERNKYLGARMMHDHIIERFGL